MSDKEKLKDLIDNAKKPTVSEWIYEVEAFLEKVSERTEEYNKLIAGIKQQGDSFYRCKNLVALFRQFYKRKYDSVELPPITKRLRAILK